MTTLCTPKCVPCEGGVPALDASAVTAAERGHKVHLYEKAAKLGGQFNLAKVIPGKEKYQQTIRYALLLKAITWLCRFNEK